MPYRDSSSAHVSRAGWGHRGYCALCNFKDELALNQRIKEGWTAPAINTWLKTHYDGLTFDRQTIYRHKKEHLGRPEDRLVTAVEATKAREAKGPRTTTNEQFLEAIRDAGYQRALDHPDEVSIDHAIKATSVLVSQKQNSNNVTIILAKIMTGGSVPMDVIEGESRELLTEGAS